MALVFVTGGARSGKSAFAVSLAAGRPAPVTFIATAEAGDPEMAERIALHRAERPAAWRTVEEPRHLERALRGVPRGACAIVDCLSLWVANRMDGETPADVQAAARAAAGLAARRGGVTIAVSNEVGMGVVPATPLGRAYRDLLGHVNATWATAADHALLVMAGQALRLAAPRELAGSLDL